MMDLSIVICTYDRYASLSQATDAVIASKTYKPETMELIVIDNTPRTKRQTIKGNGNMRVVACDETGLSNARNKGISVSTGEIVAFVDDDAIVHEDWCDAVMTAFQSFPDAEVCGGRTVPRFPHQARPGWYYDKLSEYLSCIDWGPAARPLKTGEWIVGANMAFRRRVFAIAGMFDPSLGRKGTASLLSNEEIALLRKIGHRKVYYVPSMIAEHTIPEDRLTLEWFRKRVFWQAVSDALAGETWKDSRQASIELAEIVSRAPAEYRGPSLFSYTPTNADNLKDQLSAIYLQASLMAGGARLFD